MAKNTDKGERLFEPGYYVTSPVRDGEVVGGHGSCQFVTSQRRMAELRASTTVTTGGGVGYQSGMRASTGPASRPLDRGDMPII